MNLRREIARWLPDSSPIAVAQAERDVVKIAAGASAAEAKSHPLNQAAQKERAAPAHGTQRSEK